MMLSISSKLLSLPRNSPMRVIVFEKSGGLDSTGIKESSEPQSKTGYIRQSGILKVDPAFRHHGPVSAAAGNPGRSALRLPGLRTP
jgi:hypothetical protein